VIAAALMGGRLIRVIQQQITPPISGSGASDPDNVNPPVAEAGLPPDAGSAEPNLIGLRALLDANGYRAVNCQMRNGVLVLWGTVPHEFDRMVIQTFVLGTVGMVPISDQLHVQETYAEP